ncbi:MAG: hypothetical protein CMH26_06960 [Micavibrio sp.]|nr:hypothetical protein [Micavibrio sp.]|tara:strand:- start:1368 stop:1673 length:306 start_codon:yes stop_codon:yes gene_type:complete
MLDFGWAELLMIAAIGVFVIGPNEIPTLMRSIGRVLRRIQYMKYSISNQFDQYLGDDLHSSVNFEAQRHHHLPEGHEHFDEADDDAELIDMLEQQKEAKGE